MEKVKRTVQRCVVVTRSIKIQNPARIRIRIRSKGIIQKPKNTDSKYHRNPTSIIFFTKARSSTPLRTHRFKIRYHTVVHSTGGKMTAPKMRSIIAPKDSFLIPQFANLALQKFILKGLGDPFFFMYNFHLAT